MKLEKRLLKAPAIKVDINTYFCCFRYTSYNNNHSNKKVEI